VNHHICEHRLGTFNQHTLLLSNDQLLLSIRRLLLSKYQFFLCFLQLTTDRLNSGQLDFKLL
jgi:hypothetical protein